MSAVANGLREFTPKELRMLRWLKLWDAAPAKETIRAKFANAA